ncbi:acetyl-CoA synthetase-like protein [Rostrohypoxylon terebratum]|nr:acetyl-CoA synthetase-like protein [Rostrohypoxylon terebratum]
MDFLKLIPTAVQMLSFVKHREKSLHTPSTNITEASRVQHLNKASEVCLQDVLRVRAESLPTKHLLFYQLGGTSSHPKRVSYRILYDEAKQNSLRIAALVNFSPGKPVLVHLEHHWDTILWVWAVILAGGVPVLSPPLSNVEEHREKHLQVLSQLLESPICITREASLHLFAGSNHTFHLHSIETLLQKPPTIRSGNKEAVKKGVSNGDSLAMLMLTSGSSGNAKAVCLSHRQILAAVSGKASVRPLPSDGAFLNWIGLDHVASLIEIHIQALWLGVDQVHVHAADVVASPSLFLDLLSKHRVSRSFAPNFFLAKLVKECDSPDKPPSRHWDLSNLTVLASGGEANDTRTCAAASALFAKYGASPAVITPGFGMTETCAGAIFNLDCPRSDLEKARSIASVGRCMPGIEMRIIDSATGQAVKFCQPGHLEIRGAVVFKGYYRNPAATTDAFTPDGWFRTGDEGSIDAKGNLSLIGRVKDVININGVKVVTADVQTSLEAALSTCALRVVSFPSRAPGAATEQITIAYIPNKPIDAESVVEIDGLAAQACSLVTTACRPVIFGVGSETLPLLPLTTLGKISGAKMRALFEAGVFEKDVTRHREIMDEFRRQKQLSWVDESLNETEILLRADIADIRGMTDIEEIGVETNIFQFGFTSMDVIRLKHRLDNRLGITVATAMLLKHPTIRSLAEALDKSKAALSGDAPSDALPAASGFKDVDGDGDEDIDPTSQFVVSETVYDPVVVLRSSGTKTPLWLVHPGVGEVLVFVGLAQHMSADDRPIYALRARGFESGQPQFTDIDETVTTYVSAVRQKQPKGPYAIAGYSYGTMLAFEMAKRLEGDGPGETVGFLGSFNLPPHIKMRMRQLSWNMCLLHLSQFLGLVSASFADEESAAPSDSPYRRATRREALARVLETVEESRMRDLGLGARELARWADVAHGLQSMAVDYEPSGVVPSIDVFHAEPLKVAAPSREVWVTEHLSRWKDFSRSEPRFHEVGGAHYTMIGPEYVANFSQKLKAALYSRGV